MVAKPNAKPSAKTNAKPPTKATVAPKPAFPKKNVPPRPEEFMARLPVAVGKRFEGVREFLRKQADVTEELMFFGPKAGWGFRYLCGATSLCTLIIHGERPVGVVGLDRAAREAVAWDDLSDVARRAMKLAHGGSSLAWLDLPIDGTGAGDLKTILKVKLKLGAARPS